MTTRVQLASHPRSASLARSFARGVLVDWQEDAVSDLVELLVSELVTNAVLHTGSSVDLSLHRSTGRVRVEVRDASPLAPVARHANQTATLGRGLELVEALATAWGVTPDNPGKVVWFEVQAVHPEPRGGPVTVDAGSPAPDGPRVAVQLRSVPIRLFTAMEEHTAALLREHALVLLNEDARAWHRAATPIDLPSVVQQLREEAQRGATHCDVTIMLPTTAAESVGHLVEELAVADALADAGRLLVGPALPEVLACRQWFLAEILSQLSGFEASGWSADVDTSASTGGVVDLDAVMAALATAVVVADDKNHVVFANRAAEELLGWEPGALRGQRLTAIIPARLHEAHVAGYTRFLVTRVPRILGQAVRVPARRRDDSEVDVDLVLASSPAQEGRTMFVASLQQARDAEASEAASDDLLGSVAALLVEGDPSTLHDAVLRCVSDAMPSQFAAWWQVEDAELVCVQTHSDDPEQHEQFRRATAGRRMSAGTGLPGRTWTAGETTWLTDVVADANFPRAAFALDAGLRSGVAFPVLRGSHVVAVVEFFTTTMSAPDASMKTTLDKVGRLLGMYLAGS